MELSRTSSPEFSTSIIHRRPFSLIPRKVTFIHIRSSQNHFMRPSKLYSGLNSSNLVYRPKDGFPKIVPKGLYGRNTIHFIKATINQNGADKSDSRFTKVLQFPGILLRFMKPPILFGTTVAFMGIMTRTLMYNVHLVKLSKWIILLRASGALTAILCSDSFINAINQIYDFEIDIAPIIFMTIFTTLFSLVCGALKDIEDLEGDKKCNVPTLASIYGPRKIAQFGFVSLLLNYVGAIATAIFMPQEFKQNIMIPAHAILGSYLIFQAWKLEHANYAKEASQSMYKSMLKLVFGEFILFPFI